VLSGEELTNFIELGTTIIMILICNNNNNNNNKWTKNFDDRPHHRRDFSCDTRLLLWQAFACEKILTSPPSKLPLA